MEQSLNRNELIRTLVTMREQEVASFKSYLETADLSLLASLVQQPPSEKDIGAYKYYVYNNPWHNQLIFKSKHWREWLDNNPIYANLFSEITTFGADSKPKPITILPSGINLATTTWDPATGTPPPPNLDWKAIFTSFKLEVDKLNDRIKTLTLERDQGGKSVDFLIKQHDGAMADKDKIIEKLLTTQQADKDAYVNLQKTFAESATNVAEITKQQIAQLTKDLGKVNTEFIQHQTKTGAQISNLTTEIAKKDQTILGLENKIELLKQQSGDKDKDLANMEKYYETEITTLKAGYDAKIAQLNSEGKELHNKLFNLESHVDSYTNATMASHGVSGLETVEDMRLALAGLQPWFENANLVKTWEFARDAYEELIAIQIQLHPETAPVNEADVKRKMEWQAIKNHFLAVLGNIDSKIDNSDYIGKNHNRIIVDDLNNNNNTTLNRLNNLRDYLVKSYPSFLLGKNNNNLKKLHQWEAYEGLSSRTPRPLPPKEEPKKPDETIKPTPIHSGQSTPIFGDIFSPINTQPNSEVPTPNLLKPKPVVSEELQQKKDALEAKIKERLTYYTVFSSQGENTILPATFKKYSSLSKNLSKRFGEDVRWENVLNSINTDDSWEIGDGVIGYNEIEHRLILNLTDVIIVRLMEMNNSKELDKYVKENTSWIDKEIYNHYGDKLKAFLVKDTVVEIKMIVDALTSKVGDDEKEREHYNKITAQLASKNDYYTILMHFRTFVRQRKNLLENTELLAKLNHWEEIEQVPLTQATVYDWKKVLDEVNTYLNDKTSDGFKEIRAWAKNKKDEIGNPMEDIELKDRFFEDYDNYLKDEAFEQEMKPIMGDKTANSIYFKSFVPLKAVNDENTYLNSLAVFLTGRQDIDPTGGQLYSQQNIATSLRVSLCYRLMLDKVWQSRYEGNLNKFRGDLVALANKEYALDSKKEWLELLALLLNRPIIMVGQKVYEEATSYSGLPALKYTEPFVIATRTDALTAYYVPLVHKFVHNSGILELKVTNVEANDVQSIFIFELETLKMINFSQGTREKLEFDEKILDSKKIRLISGADNYGKKRYNEIKADLGGMTKGTIIIELGNALPGDNIKQGGLSSSETIIQPSCFITAKKKEQPRFIYSLADLLDSWYSDKTIREIKLDDTFFEKANLYNNEVLDFSPYLNLEKIEYVPSTILGEGSEAKSVNIKVQEQLTTQTKLDEKSWDTSWETERGVRDNLERLTKEINDYAEKNKKNKIKSVKISGNRQLRTFIFPFAKLEKLFINNDKLVKIDVSYNRISSVSATNVDYDFETMMNVNLFENSGNFEGVVNLEELDISHNRLNKLSLEKNEKIKKLNVSYNSLTSITLWEQPELMQGGLKGLFGTEFNALGRTILNDSEKKYEKARRGLCPQEDDGLAVAVLDVKYPEREREQLENHPPVHQRYRKKKK